MLLHFLEIISLLAITRIKIQAISSRPLIVSGCRSSKLTTTTTFHSMADNSSATCEYDVSIHWFRNGLRFHDNPCLLQASKSSSQMLPLYIIDPDAPFAQTKNRRAGCIRANFILESLVELDLKLKGMNSQLFVVCGRPEEVLPEIVVATKASALFYEREPAEPIRNSDARVLEAIRERLLKQKQQGGGGESSSSKQQDDDDDFHVKGFDTHTLHPMEHYLAYCKGSVAPASYGAFTKIFQANLPAVCQEVETVEVVPALSDNLKRIMEASSLYKSKLGVHDVPSLESLGYDPKDIENRSKGGIDFDGGEDAGVKLLETMMKRTSWVCTFEKPKTSPNSLKVDTTGLSPCKCLFGDITTMVLFFVSLWL
jgi:cryptochrome